MSAVAALTRANWLAATSYKLSTVFSMLGVVGGVIPVYFVANALQPLMANAIRAEGHQYFGFVLVGTIAFSFLPVAIQGLPSAIGSGISNGTLEALFLTPTSVPAVLTGMVSYSLLWTALRALLLMIAGTLLGAAFVMPQLPLAMGLLALIVVAHVPLGLISAALVLAFRTAGPFPRVMLLLSSLFGGVYYPTHIIPSWLEYASAIFPLTYGLRALRRVLIDGASLGAVANDVIMVLGMTAVLFVAGIVAFDQALRYARKNGSLSVY